MDSLKDPATGRLYKQEITFCGKERCKKCAKGVGHGPYWYCYWWEDGKTRKKYIGKNLPASLTEDRYPYRRQQKPPKIRPYIRHDEKPYLRQTKMSSKRRSSRSKTCTAKE